MWTFLNSIHVCLDKLWVSISLRWAFFGPPPFNHPLGIQSRDRTVAPDSLGCLQLKEATPMEEVVPRLCAWETPMSAGLAQERLDFQISLQFFKSWAIWRLETFRWTFFSTAMSMTAPVTELVLAVQPVGEVLGSFGELACHRSVRLRFSMAGWRQLHCQVLCLLFFLA